MLANVELNDSKGFLIIANGSLAVAVGIVNLRDREPGLHFRTFIRTIGVLILSIGILLKNI